MTATDPGLEHKNLEDLDWRPCESPYHLDDPRDEHEGDGEYLVLFHPCPGITQKPTIRCAKWVHRIYTFSQIRCMHCNVTFAREYYVMVLGRYED